MRIFRNCMLSLFILTSLSTSINAQQSCCYQECNDTTGEAYAQSSYNSHWSALVPLALIVGAAIWFGVADGSSSDSSSNSNDGLGSLARRHHSHSYGSRSSRSSYSNSHSGHY